MQDEIRESVVVSISRSELEAMLERAVVNGLADAGLFIEDSEDRKEARADFTFVRRMRRAFDGAASKIGGAVLLAVAGGFFYLLSLGAKALMGK
ncbi:MAG: hypothetical protein K0R27_335 [Xanthobacteraceae bacterium]|jgi:hypothetical protein|nr:hypothetical protein [Xanthobacteraceae bacterium]